MSLPAASPRQPLPAFDDLRRSRYLTALTKGHSRTRAAQLAGTTLSTVNRYAATAGAEGAAFQALERDAIQEATAAVEDVLYAAAARRKTPDEISYEKARTENERRAHERAGGDPAQFTPTPHPPPPFNLKATTTYLERRDPARWAPAPDPSSTTTINVQALLTPEGAQDFQATLQARRAALQAPGEAEATPAEGGDPSDTEVYDAEVLDEA